MPPPQYHGSYFGIMTRGRFESATRRVALSLTTLPPAFQGTPGDTEGTCFTAIRGERMITDEQIVWTRDALAHLYSTAFLQRHASDSRLYGRYDRIDGATLQQMLL